MSKLIPQRGACESRMRRPSLALATTQLARQKICKPTAIHDNGASESGLGGQERRGTTMLKSADAKFELGEIVVTPAASAVLAAEGRTVSDFC